MKKKYLKDLGILLGIIIIASVSARFLAGGETLEQYADKNGRTIETATASTSGPDAASSSESIADINSNATPDSEDNNTSTASSDTASTASSAVATASDQSSSTSPITDSGTAASAESPQPAGRITVCDGFYYEPISNEVFRRISGISYPVDCTVPLEDLRYVGLKYVDFRGESRIGEMICNKDIAQDVAEIFSELYDNEYRIESIKLIDEFGGDDTASMEANNTSCFNYRVVEGTTRLSNHAYGLAIDLNPYYNPYITYNNDGTTNCSPEESIAYEDRSAAFPYKIDENDLAYKLFKQHGFKWGGNWNSVKDYQHFEKPNK